MTESEYLDLRESISSIGQTDPIWIFEGKVIDGRHRLRACTELGIEPKLREWDGKGSLLEFVVATNLKRRHLKEPQRALIAAQLAAAHHLTESQSLQDKELSDRANLPSRFHRPDHLKCPNGAGHEFRTGRII
jgi:ParB-like chromosome segregation protein Spo0J